MNNNNQVTTASKSVDLETPVRVDGDESEEIWTRMGNPVLDTNRALAEKFKTCGCSTFSVHNKCFKIAQSRRIKRVVDSVVSRYLVDQWSCRQLV